MLVSLDDFRAFLFLKQGLSGSYRYEGITGVYDYIDAAGCIQYDPVDVVGRNADITLQSRVKDYSKDMLETLLYQERTLVDGFDKMMSIYPSKYWYHMAHQRTRFNHYRVPFEQEHLDLGIQTLQDLEIFTTDTIELSGTVSWGYGKTPIARAIMDYLYYRGDIIVHHKEGTRRYFTHRHYHFEEDQDVFGHKEKLHEWLVYRRIGAVGALWNKTSDAFLGIPDFKQKDRNKAFKSLVHQNLIIGIEVESVAETLYIHCDDVGLLESVRLEKPKSRMELLAPLDPFMWDRKFIKEIFGFDYKWEIYTPKIKRKYGHYTLPIIYENQFIGRVQLVVEKNVMTIEGLWQEKGYRIPKRILNETLKRFAIFNDVRFSNRK